jgi:hypothetical protein
VLVENTVTFFPTGKNKKYNLFLVDDKKMKLVGFGDHIQMCCPCRVEFIFEDENGNNENRWISGKYVPTIMSAISEKHRIKRRYLKFEHLVVEETMSDIDRINEKYGFTIRSKKFPY